MPIHIYSMACFIRLTQTKSINLEISVPKSLTNTFWLFYCGPIRFSICFWLRRIGFSPHSFEWFMHRSAWFFLLFFFFVGLFAISLFPIIHFVLLSSLLYSMEFTFAAVRLVHTQMHRKFTASAKMNEQPRQ